MNRIDENGKEKERNWGDALNWRRECIFINPLTNDEDVQMYKKKEYNVLFALLNRGFNWNKCNVGFYINESYLLWYYNRSMR